MTLGGGGGAGGAGGASAATGTGGAGGGGNSGAGGASKGAGAGAGAVVSSAGGGVFNTGGGSGAGGAGGASRSTKIGAASTTTWRTAGTCSTPQIAPMWASAMAQTTPRYCILLKPSAANGMGRRAAVMAGDKGAALTGWGEDIGNRLGGAWVEMQSCAKFSTNENDSHLCLCCVFAGDDVRGPLTTPVSRRPSRRRLARFLSAKKNGPRNGGPC